MTKFSTITSRVLSLGNAKTYVKHATSTQHRTLTFEVDLELIFYQYANYPIVGVVRLKAELTKSHKMKFYKVYV